MACKDFASQWTINRLYYAILSYYHAAMQQQTEADNFLKQTH